MKFEHGKRRRASEYEAALVEYWKKNKTFEKSVEGRPADNAYVFYDGPPFISGSPHYGTLLSSIVKDAVPRYFTMQGRRVERRWGWDCHGLPAENFVEKKLGITDRREIDDGTPHEGVVPKITLENYIKTVRTEMEQTADSWEQVVDRVGRWVDFRGAYKTMDKDFMESVWWAFKTLYEKGKIYEGKKVLMYDTKFATPVSKTEVTMDNDAYQTVTDPSVYVKFKLVDEDASLLAWTTTPWTLPGNTAAAVKADLTYIEVEVGGEKLILAKKLAEKVLVDDKKRPLEYSVIREMSGEELIGKVYEAPVFDWRDSVLGAESGLEKHERQFGRKENSYKVWAADFVGDEDGTGIVHIAPAYGEEDYKLAVKDEIPSNVDVLDAEGRYVVGPYSAPEFAEKDVWELNKIIAKDLRDKGVVWKIEYIQHEYPFNPRSKQRIMYRAIPSWFFDVDDSKKLMLEKNENINWFPEHFKHGRFAKNIEQAPDWNISRDRFWATAMPVWKGVDAEGNEHVKVVGSYAELAELTKSEEHPDGIWLEDYHRPWIDAVEFDLDGVHYKRIDKVLDSWIEAGSMPFAQLHYPFENKEKFEANYPADFIVEYVAQVRAWFYYVHALNTALFGDEAFKNVIVTGTVAGNDGRKMSKSLGNFTDPNELMDKYSADALRFLMLASPLLSGEDFALIDKDVSDVQRKLAMVWNVYDFFTMYASVDGWDSDEVPLLRKLENPLDQWIVARIHQLRNQITENMEGYNLPDAMSGILPFVDDLSNWFVRRSRRRFWKSEDDGDKAEAYETLYYVLTKLSVLLAPFVPFMAEELYKNLTGGESVHLVDWPASAEVDEQVLADMAACRAIITDGLALRMRKNEEEDQIKVRQPLGELRYGGEKLGEYYEQIIADEMNVKKVTHGDGLWLDKTLTDELRAEGFAREVVRVVQAARKSAGLNVDDRIKLSLSVELADEWREMIATETLAVEIVQGGNYAHDEIAKVDGQNVTISLEKSDQ